MLQMTWAIMALTVALAETDPVAQVLLQLHRHQPEAFASAESLYGKTKKSESAARLATILAFAPSEKLKTPPYLYALFAFQKDSTLHHELKVKLAKLAGEGLFNHSQFQKAAQVFIQALALDGLTIAEQEYFHYQLAWCEMNQRRPTQAAGRLIRWLNKCPDCRLRREMVMDLGRFFAATDDSDQSLMAVVISKDEGSIFISGFASEIARRGKFKLKDLSQRFHDSPMAEPWLKDLFEDPRWKDLAICDRVQSLSQFAVSHWPLAAVTRGLRECAIETLQKKSALPPGLLLTYAQMPSPAPNDLLLLSSLYEKVTRPDTACRLRLRALSLAIADKTSLNASVVPTAWSALIQVCRTPPTAFAAEIAALPPLQAHEALGEALLSNQWSGAWRLEIWRRSPNDLALRKEVLLALGSSLLRKEVASSVHSDFVKETKARFAHPSASLALLQIRSREGTDAENAWTTAGAVTNWETLDSKELSEVLAAFLKQGHLKEIFAAWSHWRPLFTSNSTAFKYLLETFAATADAPILFEPQTPHDQALIALGAWRTGSLKIRWPDHDLDSLLLSDFKVLDHTASTTATLKATEMGSMAEAERAMDMAMDLLESSRQHRWWVQGLAHLNRQTLKATMGHMALKLNTGKGKDSPSFKQLARIVQRWEKDL